MELARPGLDTFSTVDAELLGDLGLPALSSCGRNSCSGGSSRRMVTGRPSIASKMPTKSAFWNGSIFGEPPSGGLLRRRRGSSSRMATMRCFAEEHVLGAAEADAFGAELAGLRRSRPGCRRWCGS